MAWNKPKTAAAGYGAKHQRLREQWRSRVDRGDVACARCGILIAAKGDPCPHCLARCKGMAKALRCGWDLGHDDTDRNIYTGPEHACCNRATARHRIEKQGRRRIRSPW